jgi:putative sugar O-methyltransferase
MNKFWDVSQNMIDQYLRACKEFANNPESFKTFKQNPNYTPVLEHVTPEIAEQYFGELKSKHLLNPTTIKHIKENDRYGTPLTFNHHTLKTISPTTVRYLKNSLDIVSSFSQNVPFKKIVEVGGGYGGLCKVFSCFNDFENYHLVDFPEVNQLSSVYLSKFRSLKGKIHHLSTDRIIDVGDIDLFISNYAFSECSLEFQELYYEKFIQNSKFFYISYNNFTEHNLNSKAFIEKAKADFTIVTEVEKIGPHVVDILYGTKK